MNRHRQALLEQCLKHKSAPREPLIDGGALRESAGIRGRPPKDHASVAGLGMELTSLPGLNRLRKKPGPAGEMYPQRPQGLKARHISNRLWPD